MTDTTNIFWVSLIAVGVGLSALYSGLETGAYGVNRVHLHLLARSAGSSRTSRLARLLLRELDKQERLLASLLIANNLANYLAVYGFTALLEGMGMNPWMVMLINAAALTPLLFIFGETLPKDLFRVRAERIMPTLAPGLVATRWALTATLALPIVQGFGSLLTRALRGSDPAQVVSARARLVALLKEGRRHGALSAAQTAMVDRAAQLTHKSVTDVMTPWRRVVTIGTDWSRTRVDDAARRSPQASYPVVDRRGRVIGAARSIDLWINPGAAVTSLMRPVARVEPGAPLTKAIGRLRSAEAKVGLVNKRGKPVGIVTERDLFAPLFGEGRAMVGA